MSITQKDAAILESLNKNHNKLINQLDKNSAHIADYTFTRHVVDYPAPGKPFLYRPYGEFMDFQNTNYLNSAIYYNPIGVGNDNRSLYKLYNTNRKNKINSIYTFNVS